MKTCPYCGAEYPDGTVACAIDQTLLDPPSATFATTSPPVTVSTRPEYEFTPLTEAQMQMDLVTLVRCGTLMSADLIASKLRAGGIESFIPDQSLAQTMGFNLGSVGFVRVQVSPADYEQAKNIISN